jgi:hypothetical protein
MDGLPNNKPKTKKQRRIWKQQIENGCVYEPKEVKNALVL